MLGEVSNPLEMKAGIYPSIAQNSRDETNPDEVSDQVKIQIAIEMENYRKEIKKEVKEEIKQEDEEEKKKRKKEKNKDRNYCEDQCGTFLLFLLFIGWGICYYYLYDNSPHDYEEMPSSVIAVLIILGLFGALSCACCIRYNVKQRAWMKKLRRERRVKENKTSSTDSSL